MTQIPEELPEVFSGINGESDVVAERSGCITRRTRRPLCADMPGDGEEALPLPRTWDEFGGDDPVRPDIGPVG
ncbi:hypothetical protein [Nonomuraea maritima]|uniref:hypothetical protein n=1 Tax=Nonomuraea maritima TaxID=683260 RepID=UPI0037148CB0